MAEPTLYLFKKTWKYAEGTRWRIVAAICMYLFSNATSFIIPFMIGLLFNTVQNEGLTEASLPKIGLYIFGIFFFRVLFWAFHGPARVWENTAAFLTKINYKNKLLEGCMDLPLKWHNEHHSGDTIDKIEKGTQALYRYSSEIFLVVEAVLKTISSLAVLMYFNWIAGSVTVFLIMITLTVIVFYDRFLIPNYKSLNKQENKISAKIFDSISNITTVVILRLEKLVNKGILASMTKPLKLYVKTAKHQEFKWFLVSMLAASIAVMSLGSYVWMQYVTGATIMVGTLYLIYDYVDRINNVFFRFAYKYSEIVKHRTDVANAEEISNEFEMARRRQGNLPKSWSKIELKDIDYEYEPVVGDQATGKLGFHLGPFDMDIVKGRKIALIGESGGGKTTTLKLVRQLFPFSSQTFLDGKKISGLSEVANSISLIPQDPEIFSSTIKENITLGTSHSQKEVERLAEIAGFHKVAINLPNGYESSINEKGVNLSGGEKQRLALARGLLASKKKEIVLLDEPTSSVDTETELKVFKKVFKELKGKAVIASVHRLHLLKLFDYIYYFHKGKVVAHGTFGQLKKNPKFMRILRKAELD